MKHKIGVLNPIALITHQPALASNIENAHPKVIAANGYHQRVDDKAPAITKIASTIANTIANIPIFRRAAFPFAPILHCMLSPSFVHLKTSSPSI